MLGTLGEPRLVGLVARLEWLMKKSVCRSHQREREDAWATLKELLTLDRLALDLRVLRLLCGPSLLAYLEI